MRKFFSDLIPTISYWPLAQQEEDIQVIPINSELEAVLTGDGNHPQYGSQEQPSEVSSWNIKIQDTLAEAEKKIEPLHADYSKWNCLSIVNATLAALVPPATYAALWGLDAYISYPITHTPRLLQLYNQLQKTLVIFGPIKTAYQYLHYQVGTSFWNMIKMEDAQSIEVQDRLYILLNNCFWQQGFEIYRPDTFYSPAAVTRLFYSKSDRQPYLFRYRNSIFNSGYPELICDYFSSNHSLIQTNRTPSLEHCKLNLNNMCGNLTELKQIVSGYDSLSEQIQQLEKAISAEGGDYHLISNTLFWGIMIPISCGATAYLMYFCYSNYKNRQELNTTLKQLQNNPPQLDEQETKNLGEIISFLNQVMPGAHPVSIEQNTSIVMDRLKDSVKKMNNHFHFFKCCGKKLPKELIFKIGEYLYAADTSKGDEKKALTM